MNISIFKTPLFELLQKTSGIIERKNTLPIFSHILFNIDGSNLSITSSNTEIEIQAFTNIESSENFQFTVNARKLLDIVKLLDDGVLIHLEIKNDMLQLKVKKSIFTLGTLPPQDFPQIQSQLGTLNFKIEENILKNLLANTSISMALEDVRYYLKGMLFEIRNNSLRTITTDGHRLSLDEASFPQITLDDVKQVIVPRKTILELNRILQPTDRLVGIELSSNFIRFYHPELNIISKLIDGRYPDYQRVIPSNIVHNLNLDRLVLKSAIQRTSVLSNEKYKAIRFDISPGILKITGDNAEHEQAEESIEIDNRDLNFSIGFNFSYLLEILSTIDTAHINLGISDDKSSCIIQGIGETSAQYIVMPLRT